MKMVFDGGNTMARPISRAVARAVCALLAIFCMARVSRAEVAQVDTKTLLDLVGREKQNVFLLDVRTPREYAAGRVPGSVLIPMNDVPARIAEIPKQKKVVVICASGSRSAAVARFLDQQGYPWVGNYGRGVAGYASDGHALER